MHSAPPRTRSGTNGIFFSISIWSPSFFFYRFPALFFRLFSFSGFFSALFGIFRHFRHFFSCFSTAFQLFFSIFSAIFQLFFSSFSAIFWSVFALSPCFFDAKKKKQTGCAPESTACFYPACTTCTKLIFGERQASGKNGQAIGTMSTQRMKLINTSGIPTLT